MNSTLTIIDVRPVRDSLIRFSIKASHNNVIYDITVNMLEHTLYEKDANVINFGTLTKELTDEINEMHITAEIAQHIKTEQWKWEVTTDESISTHTTEE